MKYARITLDPSQGVNYYEIKFSRLDKQGKSFQDWGPKCGIAYLCVLENLQSRALERK